MNKVSEAATHRIIEAIKPHVGEGDLWDIAQAALQASQESVTIPMPGASMMVGVVEAGELPSPEIAQFANPATVLSNLDAMAASLDRDGLTNAAYYMRTAAKALSCRKAVQTPAAQTQEIMAEVQRATVKFPTWPTRIIDAGNVVSEEAGELAKACLQVTYEPEKETLEGVREEAIQTAAMCIRFLMSMDRYDTTPGPQHEQNPTGE